MTGTELSDYWRFTGPQRLDKAMHTLEGLLQGITADGHVEPKEIDMLVGWLTEHAEFANHHPFNEIIPMLNTSLSDQQLGKEEVFDIMWLCSKLRTGEAYFDYVTSDLQRLHGIMHGIVSDGKITKEELIELSNWITQHQHLKTCWPFDEIESLITSVLRDGEIDKDEQRLLMTFFRQFGIGKKHRAVDPVVADIEMNVGGLCAVCPEVVFSGKTFCFTGVLGRCKRSDAEDRVRQLGGLAQKGVTQQLDYLVIGADGNPCWAFSCYGRKVEQAMDYRKSGRKSIVLVHEMDFWDAMEEVQA